MTKIMSQNSPHLRTKNSTFKMMMEFFACCIVLWVCAMIMYGTYYSTTVDGISYDFNFTRGHYAYYYVLIVFAIGMISMLGAVVADAIYYLPYFWLKEDRLKLAKGETRLTKYLKKLVFNYSYVTGLLVALLLPVGTPLWIPFVISFLSIFVFKNLFGGFGANIFNPAIIGRVFAQICFASQLKTYIASDFITVKPDIIQTGASVTTNMISGSFNAGFNMTSQSFGSISTLDLFLGKYFGSIGETLFIVLVIIAIYLCIRKIVDWRVIVTFVATFYITYLLMGLCSNKGIYSFEMAFRNLVAGGAVFGAVLCLTDPVTSPVNRTGKVIFAAGSAFITILIRLFASAPEGMAYSILVMNMLTPLIDRKVFTRTNQKMPKKYVAASVVPFASLLLGISFGAMNFTPTPKPVEAGASLSAMLDSYGATLKEQSDLTYTDSNVTKISTLTLDKNLVENSEGVYFVSLQNVGGKSYGTVNLDVLLSKVGSDYIVNNMYIVDDSNLTGSGANASAPGVFVNKNWYGKYFDKDTKLMQSAAQNQIKIASFANDFNTSTGGTSFETIPGIQSALQAAIKGIEG